VSITAHPQIGIDKESFLSVAGRNLDRVEKINKNLIAPIKPRQLKNACIENGARKL
jgi:hypothetical protein